MVIVGQLLAPLRQDVPVLAVAHLCDPRLQIKDHRPGGGLPLLGQGSIPDKVRLCHDVLYGAGL